MLRRRLRVVTRWQPGRGRAGHQGRPCCCCSRCLNGIVCCWRWTVSARQHQPRRSRSKPYWRRRIRKGEGFIGNIHTIAVDRPPRLCQVHPAPCSRPGEGASGEGYVLSFSSFSARLIRQDILLSQQTNGLSQRPHRVADVSRRRHHLMSLSRPPAARCGNKDFFQHDDGQLRRHH